MISSVYTLLYLPEKRLALEACHLWYGKEVAFVYLAFFDDGAAFPYLPVLPCDFLSWCGHAFACFVIEHAAGGYLDVRFREQLPLAEDQVDMIVCLALVVVEGGHALHTVPPAELLRKVRRGPAAARIAYRSSGRAIISSLASIHLPSVPLR